MVADNVTSDSVSAADQLIGWNRAIATILRAVTLMYEHGDVPPSVAIRLGDLCNFMSASNDASASWDKARVARLLGL